MSQKAKPAGANGGHRTITVCNWKPLNSGSLREFLVLKIPPALMVHNCQLLEVGERRWIGLPARRFVMADGKVHYEPILEFADRKAYWQFERTALEAVEAYLKARGEW